MRIRIAALLLALASPALATDPQFGAIRVEATQNVRHAFVSAKTQGTNETKVSKDEWNAAHTAPAVVLLTLPTGIVWPAQPAAVTEFCGVTTFRFRATLTNYTQIRLSAQVISAGAASSALRLQYTTDTTGASGWAYLDGVSGPSVSTSASGVALSATVTIADAAKADVLLRLVGINGDGVGGTCYSNLKAASATLADAATLATTATTATTASALVANGANCSAGSAALGVDASGAVESCFDVATQTELDAHTSATSAHSATDANTASRIVMRDASGNFSAGTVSAALSGNATTATTATTAAAANALAADGANCSAGQFPLGVDASGAAQSCTALPTTIAGTANQISVSGPTGAVTVSIPTNPTLPGTTTGTFSGNITGDVTGNAATATALAANGANCSSGSYPLGVDASGAVESCTSAASGLTVNSTTITGGTTARIPYNNAGTYGESLATATSDGTLNVPAGQSYQQNGSTILKADVSSTGGLSSGHSAGAGAQRWTFVGPYAGSGSGASYYETCVGYQACYLLTTGESSTAVGDSALYNAASSRYNSAVGHESGYDVAGVNVGANSFLGYRSGRGITTGVKNTILGANTNGLPATLSNNVILADGDGIRRFWASTVPLAESATTIVTIPVATGQAGMTGGVVIYTIGASDGTDNQVRSGKVFFSLSNKAGAETCEVHGTAVNPDETQDWSVADGVTTGTLTYDWSVDVTGTNQCKLVLTPTSSLTQTAFRADVTVNLNAAGVISIP